MDYGLIVPQGWRMDFVGIADPVEAYETMTRVAQEIILFFPDSKDLTPLCMFAKECMQR